VELIELNALPVWSPHHREATADFLLERIDELDTRVPKVADVMRYNRQLVL
jgi:hypothetical protein